MYQHKRARSCAGRNAPSSAVRPPALHGATDACRRAGGAVWPPRPAPAGHTGSWHLIEARTTAIAASTLQGARKESPECALTGGSRGGLEVTYHAPPTLPIRRARGASARPGTHAERAGASGAAGGAPRARRGRPRARTLFGTPPPETCTRVDAGRLRVTPHAESPVALDERVHPHRAGGGAAARPRRRPPRSARGSGGAGTVGAAVRRRLRRLAPGLGRSAGHW